MRFVDGGHRSHGKGMDWRDGQPGEYGQLRLDVFISRADDTVANSALSLFGRYGLYERAGRYLGRAAVFGMAGAYGDVQSVGGINNAVMAEKNDRADFSDAEDMPGVQKAAAKAAAVRSVSAATGAKTAQSWAMSTLWNIWCEGAGLR